MQNSVIAVALLVYGGAAVEAWRTSPGAATLKLERLAVDPGGLALLSLTVALLVPVLRGALLRHVWISYRTGFGQSVISVLAGMGVLIVLAAFCLWPPSREAKAVLASGGGFSAYAAGIGLLLAEAILGRRIETDPILRSQIEADKSP